MPYPFLEAQDLFETAGTSLLHGRALDFPGEVTWNVLRGGFVVQGGGCHIVGTVPTKSIAVLAGFESRARTRVSVDLRPALDDHVGIVLQMQPSGRDYYLVFFASPSVHVFIVEAGVSTWLASYDVSGAFGPVNSMSAEFDGLSGTPLKVFWNGVQRIALAESTYGTGLPGIQITDPDRWISSFAVYVDSSTTTVPITTMPPTTVPATTVPTPTSPPTTIPITSSEPTFPPTTVPTPPTPVTDIPTTLPPDTTVPPTTEPPEPVLEGELVRASFSYVDIEDRLIVRAWVTNDNGVTRTEPLVPASCVLELVDELGVSHSVSGAQSPANNEARFVVPQARLYSQHLYVARVSLLVEGDAVVKGPALFPLPVS